MKGAPTPSQCVLSLSLWSNYRIVLQWAHFSPSVSLESMPYHVLLSFSHEEMVNDFHLSPSHKATRNLGCVPSPMGLVSGLANDEDHQIHFSVV